jgi:protein lin-54
MGERKPCNCKRSQCLKLYCDCFSMGGFCDASCSCVSCCNTEADLVTVQHARKIILSKDPLAFHAKVTAMAGHKRGCKCKRSKCLKKYCECFNAGAKCNPEICQCEGCKNW